MTKNFCDICGAPAIKIPGVYYSLEIGEPFEREELETPKLTAIRTKVVARLHFSFADHKTGFGGPPDLCSDCANDIISKLKIVGTEQS